MLEFFAHFQLALVPPPLIGFAHLLRTGVDPSLLAGLGIVNTHQSHVGQLHLTLVVHLHGNEVVLIVGNGKSLAVIALIDKLNPAEVLELTRKARHECLEMLFLEYREVDTANLEIPVWHIDRDRVLFSRNV